MTDVTDPKEPSKSKSLEELYEDLNREYLERASRSPERRWASLLTRPRNPALPPPRVKWPEWISLLLAVPLVDLTLYPKGGYASLAALFVGVGVLLWTGAPERKPGKFTWVLPVMLLVLAARMVWEGTPMGVLLGIGLLAGWNLHLQGLLPHLLEGSIATVYHSIMGVTFLPSILKGDGARGWMSESRIVALLLPAMILVVFSLLFILANPVLREIVQGMSEWVENLLLHSPITIRRTLLWGLVLCVFAGLLRGEVVSRKMKECTEYFELGMEALTPTHALPVNLYTLARNTLSSVTVLFAAYLVFEFTHLWMREIPKGFYYSGYAHEGAMWLTLALAFSTFTLGYVFRGALLDHPKAPLLKRLAWIWTLENFLLAVCVYYRVHIYIDYNGLSPMRMVALFGILAVLLGFALVVVKVFRGKALTWLIRMDLWALFLVVYLHFITPVHSLVNKYNVSRILAGNPAPSVQISVQKFHPSGIPPLLGLLDCEDPIIRNGVRAYLEQKQFELQIASQRDGSVPAWRTRQVCRERTLELLKANEKFWLVIQPPEHRKGDLEEFHRYAGQWFH